MPSWPRFDTRSFCDNIGPVLTGAPGARAPRSLDMNGYIVRNQRVELTSEAPVFSELCRRAVEWRMRMHTGQLLSESRELIDGAKSSSRRVSVSLKDLQADVASERASPGSC